MLQFKVGVLKLTTLAVKAQLGRDEQCAQTRRDEQDCEGDAIKEAADSEM